MISIIIIVKSDRAIENALKKLVKIPKPEKTEILVIDASEGNLDDIKNMFPSVRWIYYHNKKSKEITIPEQRNLGLKKAQGDIITFIDSDCIPENNWLIELAKSVNNEEKIIEPLKNRCEVIRFKKPKDEEVYNYLIKICEAEKLSFTDDGLFKLIKIYSPSIRRMVGELQKLFNKGLVVDENNVRSEEEEFLILWSKLKQGKVFDVHNNITTNNIDVELLTNFFFEMIINDTELNEKQCIGMVLAIGEINYRLCFGDKNIAMSEGLIRLYSAMVKNK